MHVSGLDSFELHLELFRNGSHYHSHGTVWSLSFLCWPLCLRAAGRWLFLPVHNGLSIDQPSN